MESKVRKIQLTGGSTYIVSLPLDWIASNSLKKGSEVEVAEEGNSIVINPGVQKRELVRTINVNDKVDPKRFQRILVSAYIANFEILVVRSRTRMNESIRESVKNFSKLVMGVEIFEESSNRIVLQNVLDSTSFPFQKAIRRMSGNVESMLQDVLNGIRDLDPELLKNVERRDDEIDRYQWYIFREINKNPREPGSTFTLILSRILERIADHAVNICSMIVANQEETKASMELIAESLSISIDTFKDAMNGFYQDRFENLNEIIDMKHKIRIDKEKFARTIRSTKSSILPRISEEIFRIGFYGTDIAELAMDRIISSREEIDI